MNAVLDPTFSAALRDELVARVTAVPKPWYRRRPVLIGAGAFAAVAVASGAVAAGRGAPPGGDAIEALGAPVSATLAGTRTVDLGVRPANAAAVAMTYTCLTPGTIGLSAGGASVTCASTEIGTSTATGSWVAALSPGQTTWTFTANPEVRYAVTIGYASVSPTQWGVNENGLTYGVEKGGVGGGTIARPRTPDTVPDLLLVVATNGRTGYAYSKDLDPPDPKSPADAVARMAWYRAHPDYVRCVPVYESDGRTRVGVFAMGNGTIDGKQCSPSDVTPTP